MPIVYKGTTVTKVMYGENIPDGDPAKKKALNEWDAKEPVESPAHLRWVRERQEMLEEAQRTGSMSSYYYWLNNNPEPPFRDERAYNEWQIQRNKLYNEWQASIKTPVDLDYVYKWDTSKNKYVIVFSKKPIYSYTITLSFSKSSYNVDTSTTTKAWDDWDTVYTQKKKAVKDAEDALSTYKSTHTEPNQYTDGWINWNNTLTETVNNRNSRAKFYNTVMVPKHNQMVKDYNDRVQEVKDAESDYNKHHNSTPPPKTIPNEHYDPNPTIPNPKYDPDEHIYQKNPALEPWYNEHARLYLAYQRAIGTPGEAAAKKAYDDHAKTKPTPDFIEVENPDYDPRQTIDNPNYDPDKEIDNPLYGEWTSTDGYLKNAWDTLKEAWDADQPGAAKALSDYEESMSIYAGSIATLDKEIKDLKDNEYTPKDNPDYKKYHDDVRNLEGAISTAKTEKSNWYDKQPYKWVQETRYDYTVKVSTSRALVDGYINTTFAIGGHNVNISLRASESSKSGTYNGTTTNASYATIKMSTPAGTYDSSVNAGSNISYSLEW